MNRSIVTYIWVLALTLSALAVAVMLSGYKQFSNLQRTREKADHYLMGSVVHCARIKEALSPLETLLEAGIPDGASDHQNGTGPIAAERSRTRDLSLERALSVVRPEVASLHRLQETYGEPEFAKSLLRLQARLDSTEAYMRSSRSEQALAITLQKIAAVRIAANQLQLLHSARHDKSDEHLVAGNSASAAKLASFALGSLLLGGVLTWHIIRRVRDLLKKDEASREELRKSRDAAEESNRLKSSFLANMSHEIRTSMTAIIGYSELLLEEISEEEKHHAARTIAESGTDLLELINGILDLSKIEAGKLETDRIACSPFEILESVLALMAPLARKNGLDLELLYANGIPESILSDPAQVRQVLINLIGNAIKFTAEGTILVSVCFRRKSDGNEPLLEIEVKDDGIGISSEQMNGLFQPFTQVDGSSTRKFGGTGLGLTIAKKHALSLGGGITVDSKPNRGSVFRLTIPTGPVEGTRMLRENPQVVAAPRQGCSTHLEADTRILLAEDNAVSQKIVTRILERAGAKVTTVWNGKEAVETALAASRDSVPFGVILMDMQMPDLDGYEATRELRRKGYELPIIALTAHAMSQDREKCLSIGCTDFATKPIQRDELLEKINQHGVNREHRHEIDRKGSVQHYRIAE